MQINNGLSIPKQLKEKITAAIPDFLIKERTGGGNKTLSYLSGSTVTDMLNNIFGYMWSWEVIKEWTVDSIPYFNAYSKVPEDQKVFHSGKKGAWEEQGPVAHVLGKLTVYVKLDNGEVVKIIKDGYGSKSIMGKQNDQESIYKAAGTDALKKASSLLGIGLQLYRDEEEQAYFDQINYENPWDAESLEKYSEELAFLSSYCEQCSLNEDDLANLVYNYSNGATYEVLPENIKGFVDYIKSQI